MDTSEFVVEARIAKRWCAMAGSEYELAARRLFERASYKCPADTMLRLRRARRSSSRCQPTDSRGCVSERRPRSRNPIAPSSFHPVVNKRAGERRRPC